MARERVEDLGRIMAMVENPLDHEIFKLFECRNKDSEDWFLTLDPEKQDDLIHSLAYGLSSVNEKLGLILEIASGEDRLNFQDKEA